MVASLWKGDMLTSISMGMWKDMDKTEFINTSRACCCCYCLLAKLCQTFCSPTDYSLPAPLSMGISSKNNGVAIHLFSCGDFPDPRIQPMFQLLQWISYQLRHRSQ